MTDPRLKMISYRAWHRGFREADLILGPFADAHLAGFAAHQLDEFETLLDQPDPDLYAWILGRAPTPGRVRGRGDGDDPRFRFFAARALGAPRRPEDDALGPDSRFQTHRPA